MLTRLCTERALGNPQLRTSMRTAVARLEVATTTGASEPAAGSGTQSHDQRHGSCRRPEQAAIDWCEWVADQLAARHESVDQRESRPVPSATTTVLLRAMQLALG